MDVGVKNNTNKTRKRVKQRKTKNMNNIDQLIQQLDFEEQNIQRKKKALNELRPRIEGYKRDITVSFGGYGEQQSIDFDYLSRADTIDLITFFKAGKWDKEVQGDEGKINYVNKGLGTMKLRIYGAEPPPQCKIVEVPVVIPAQPARTYMKKVIQCPHNESVVNV